MENVFSEKLKRFFLKTTFKTNFFENYLIRKSFTFQIWKVKDFLIKHFQKTFFFKVIFRKKILRFTLNNFLVFTDRLVLHTKKIRSIRQKLRRKFRKTILPRNAYLKDRSNMKRLFFTNYWTKDCISRFAPNLFLLLTDEGFGHGRLNNT